MEMRENYSELFANINPEETIIIQGIREQHAFI